MVIGVISDSDAFIPLVGMLLSQRIKVSVFYSPSPDLFVNRQVELFSRQVGLSIVIEREKDGEVYDWLHHQKVDICFVIGYNRRIALDRLKGVSTQLFNIHFGLLPSFRGPSPVFWQLKKGGAHLGLSIHRLADQLDRGEVYWKKEIPNLPHYNLRYVSQLFNQLCVEGVAFILQRLVNHQSLIAITDQSAVSDYQKRPTLKDVSIDWTQMKASEIVDLVKACNPWNKGAITSFKGQEVKLMDAVIGGMSAGKPGEITDLSEKLSIATVDGKTLESSMLFFMDAYWSVHHLQSMGFRVGDRFEALSF